MRWNPTTEEILNRVASSPPINATQEVYLSISSLVYTYFEENPDSQIQSRWEKLPTGVEEIVIDHFQYLVTVKAIIESMRDNWRNDSTAKTILAFSRLTPLIDSIYEDFDLTLRLAKVADQEVPYQTDCNRHLVANLIRWNLEQSSRDVLQQSGIEAATEHLDARLEEYKLKGIETQYLRRTILKKVMPSVD